jgi:hypothetical protein
MTVPLTNLLPNSAAFSAGAGDLCPDSMVTAAECQCRGLKRAPTVARTVAFTGLPDFCDQPLASPAPSRRFEKPFKPHK